jgi:hypothetical protein
MALSAGCDAEMIFFSSVAFEVINQECCVAAERKIERERERKGEKERD